MPAYDTVTYDPPAPLARVTLRGPSGATVPDLLLLIDTGADTTLLPANAVARLGVRAHPALACELIGFDGNRTTAQAVDLEMLFLRKAFRGRYLLIDRHQGILGRDVLASLVLILDGPAGEWSQHVRLP